MALALVGAIPQAGAVAASAAETDNGAALARSLAAAEKRMGSANADLLPILAPLAQVRFEHAELAEAMALRRRSLKIAIAAYGGNSLQAADAMAAMARLYIELHRYLDAEPLAIAATEILSDRLGAANPALAPVLADRARIALAWGDKRRALNWAEQAVATDGKRGAQHGDRLRALGAVLASEERFDDAEHALKEALVLDRTANRGLSTARDLAQLAEIYLRQKRYHEALPLIEEAISIDQERLGATHPLIAEDFDTLGRVYLETNRPDAAAKALQTAIDRLERGAGRGTPTLAYIELDLARAEQVLGHKERAQRLFTKAQRILNDARDEERERQRDA